MTDSQSALLMLLSKAVFNNHIQLFEVNWIEALSEAKSQTVTQLAYSVLDKNQLTPVEVKQWKQAAAVALSNNVRISHNHALLHKWMAGAGIPYVILKGAASGSYYPIPVYRSMGDVDFLVKMEDLDRAGKVLEEKGLTSWDEDHISHIVYRGPEMHYEMHFNLAGTPNGDAGELVREYIKDIFEKASLHKVGDGEAIFPSPFHHGLILLLHTCHHLTGEGIGLRHLCDWAVFENSFSDDEFRVLFEEKLKAIGLWKFAQILTRASIKYLGAYEKEWALADDEIVDSIIEDILVGGNFGIKDCERSNQAYIISSRGKNGVGGTSIAQQVFVSLNDVVYTRWPLAKKWKVVLPFGWVYYGVKQVIKILKGERKKVHLSKLIEGASKRRDLYEQFHLYETEY